MTEKALISELTWRSLEMQKDAFPDMPHFIIPDEMQWLMRDSTRRSVDRIHVVSLAVIASNERGFREFLEIARKRKCEIVSQEDKKTFKTTGNCENLVKWWKDARRNGVAKIGGQKSADNKKDLARKAIQLIRADWPRPSSEVPTDILRERSGLSLNTIKKYLGPRPVAQYNYRTKHKIELKKAILEPPPKKAKPLDFCGVYVFQIEPNIFKVGCSANAHKRLKDVSAYQKKSMKVVALYNMDIDKAFALENEVHHRLNNYRAHEYNGREIFQVSLGTINRTIKRAMKHLFEVPNE